MRIYEKNVQYNDRTDKKLKGFLPHAQHLLPPTDRGEEEGLTACSDCSLRVQQRFRKLSISHRRKTCQFTLHLPFWTAKQDDTCDCDRQHKTEPDKRVRLCERYKRSQHSRHIDS